MFGCSGVPGIQTANAAKHKGTSHPCVNNGEFNENILRLFGGLVETCYLSIVEYKNCRNMEANEALKTILERSHAQAMAGQTISMVEVERFMKIYSEMRDLCHFER